MDVAKIKILWPHFVSSEHSSSQRTIWNHDSLYRFIISISFLTKVSLLHQFPSTEDASMMLTEMKTCIHLTLCRVYILVEFSENKIKNIFFNKSFVICFIKCLKIILLAFYGLDKIQRKKNNSQSHKHNFNSYF